MTSVGTGISLYKFLRMVPEIFFKMVSTKLKLKGYRKVAVLVEPPRVTLNLKGKLWVSVLLQSPKNSSSDVRDCK